MKEGDRVEIMTPITLLQPRRLQHDDHLTVKLSYKQWGTITYIDGGYIGVKPKRRSWEVECYDSELSGIEYENYKNSENYPNKKAERLSQEASDPTTYHASTWQPIGTIISK